MNNTKRKIQYNPKKLPPKADPPLAEKTYSPRFTGEADILQAKKRQANTGYTLLFAVLISSLVLSIGIAVFNISLKELLLSSAGRESQFAFYAADTGTECALYWDFKSTAFSSTTAFTTITCLGQDKVVGGVPLGKESRFTLIFPPPEEYCVEVVVVKEDVIPRRTRIEAFGRNSCDSTTPRRVERAIRVRY